MPGATVDAVNQGTGGKNEAKSSSAGSYRFSDIPIGVYTVTVTAPGFATASNTGVQVQINSTTALNVALKAGAVTDVVNVDASGLRLETESSDISGTISNKQIEDLPLSLLSGVGGARSPETFVFLPPGTTGPGSGTQGNSGNGVFFSRLSGGQAYGAEVLLDGASIQRSENGSSFDETSPSVEALQEFKVTTSTPQAEFGRTTAGIESFATKGGTNAYHGNGFIIVKNRIFDANSWFNDAYSKLNCVGVSEINCAYKKGQDSKYDYGGVFSGPVRILKLYNGKDRSFFLFAWENFKFHQSYPIQSTVPTAAERTGDFRDILGGPIPANLAPYNTDPCTGQQVFYNEIFDNSTDRPGPAPGQYCRSPFATPNVIPASQLSAAAQKLIAGLPLPNQTGIANAPFPNYNNYSTSGNVPNTNTMYTIRIDQNIGIKSKIFASYNTRENFKLTAAPDFPAPFNNSGFVQDFTTHYSRAGWDYTFGPTLLNHVNLGYNRTNSINLGAGFNSPNANSANIGGLVAPFFPVLNFVGPENVSTLGQQQNGQNIDNGIRINDSVSWQKGRNSFKFGVDVRFQQYSVIDYDTDSLTFYRDQTAVQNFGPQFLYDGSTFASFLTGYVGASSQTVFNDRPRWNSHYLAGFVQDDIKFSSNLTVNLGVRYDVDVPRHEALNRTSELSLTAPDPAAGNLPGALVFAANCKCNTAWADTWYKDIGPRVGLAYVLPGTNGKGVIRAGGAVIYGPLQYNDFGGAMSAGYTQARSPVGANPERGIFGHSFQLDSGFKNADGSAISFAPSTDPGQLTGGVGQFNAVGGEVIVPSDGRPSMTGDWSLQLQDEIAQDLIFKMGYIGQVAQNLRSGDLTNYNNISKQYFALGDKLNSGQFYIPQGGSNSGVNAPYSTFAGNLGQALRPFPQYDFIQGDCCLENLGHSSYNAMVVSLERHFRQGLNLQASYTWAKALTDADSTIPFSYVSGNQLHQGQDNSNLRLEKAVSVQNIPQTLSLSYLYQLPFGKGRMFVNNNRALDLLVGGWEVGAIQRYESGQNISFGCTSGIPYYQNCVAFTEGPAAGSTHDYTTAAFKAKKNGPNQFNGQSWFKPAYRPAGTNGPNDAGVPMAQAAFVDQNAEGPGRTRALDPNCGGGSCSFAPFSLGNIPRVTQAITGPSFKAEDFSVLKDFHITEKKVFEFKAEVFDAFNRHRFALPDLQQSDSTGNGFGIPTGTDYGPRQMQMTAKFNF
ncbi:MAG TPA: TonB-dependent receptor [Acidobacteriaceae bacterium]|nr:TonB-dependent receptor [Acidobacteriaceae bacterium]